MRSHFLPLLICPWLLACGPTGGASNTSDAASPSGTMGDPNLHDNTGRSLAVNEAEARELVSGSDDVERYRSAFAKAAQQLIADGRCTRADFTEIGGWMKSQNSKADPVYFTYCGGMILSNRIYLNAKNGRIYR